MYPQHQITLIAYAAWANLARQLPYWDAVIPLNVSLGSKYPVQVIVMPQPFTSKISL
ncbi:hypothetical protein JZU46_04450 [bacterium]|jgi:hypothetical protein|nr:hypothetical protein [bacterium]